MTIDPFLPSFVCPAQGEECFAVRGRRVGESVEISLTREHHQRHRHSDTYTRLELLAVRRFGRHETSRYRTYTNGLEDAARYAARGELGYSVHTEADGHSVQVSLVARLLAESGEIRTEVTHRHRFEDPESHVTLVQANEKATELRALAEWLNENWASLHQSRLEEIQAEYDRADAEALAAAELQQIVESEAD